MAAGMLEEAFVRWRGGNRSVEQGLLLEADSRSVGQETGCVFIILWFDYHVYKSRTNNRIAQTILLLFYIGNFQV
jgi:hypothetical protein